MVYRRMTLTLLLVAAAQTVYSNQAGTHGLLRGASSAVGMQVHRALMSLQEECMLKGCEVTNDDNPSLAHPGEGSGIGGGTKEGVAPMQNGEAHTNGTQAATGRNGQA